MPTPTPFVNASVSRALGAVQPAVLDLRQYEAPEQDGFRIKLNQNENPYDLPDSLKESILREMRYASWNRYPESDPNRLREMLAGRWGLTPAGILPGNGSNSLLYTLMRAVIAPGDRVMTTTPDFALFETTARIHGARLRSVLLNPDFSPPAELILKETAKARLSLFSSPGNPTGRTLSADLLESILQTTPGLVLWDEAYGEFCSQSVLPSIERYPNLLVLKTFSKAFGLAGLRAGFLLGHPRLIGEIRKTAVPYEMSRFSIQTALKLLQLPQVVEGHVRAIVSEKQALYRALNEIPGIQAVMTDANFLLIRVPRESNAYGELKRHGILVRDMSPYPLMENMLRVTVGTPWENRVFAQVLQRIVSGC